MFCPSVKFHFFKYTILLLKKTLLHNPLYSFISLARISHFTNFSDFTAPKFQDLEIFPAKYKLIFNFFCLKFRIYFQNVEFLEMDPLYIYTCILLIPLFLSARLQDCQYVLIGTQKSSQSWYMITLRDTWVCLQYVLKMLLIVTPNFLLTG